MSFAPHEHSARTTTVLLVLAALVVGTETGRRFTRPGTLAQDAEDHSKADPRRQKTSKGPLRLVPQSRRESRPILLPIGEVYLLDLLQGLADSNARTVYLDGKVDAGSSVRIGKTYSKLSFAEAKSILAEHGLYLGESEMTSSVSGKKKSFWVQAKVTRPTQRGALVRRSSGGVKSRGRDASGRVAGGRVAGGRVAGGRVAGGRVAGGGAPTGKAGPRGQNPGSAVQRRPVAGADDDVRVYRRDDGSLITWLVQYETSSRTDAEDMASVMKANLEASAR